MKNKILGFIICSAMLLAGCGTATNTEVISTDDSSATTQSEQGTTTDGQIISTSGEVSTTSGINVLLTGDYSDTALSGTYDAAEAVTISLADDATVADSEAVTIEGNVITITAGGTYVLTGTLTNGQIVVEAPEDENVQLVLDDANITCADNAAILVSTAKNVFLTLAEESENTVADGTTNATEGTEEEVTAAIYSKTDLIINGTGSLNVTGNYKDGITSKDDLELISGTITVTAADDGIVGKDSVSIHDGTITVTAADDGIKASNAEDTEKGYLVIDGGTISVTAGDDGIKSETALVINDGTVTVAESYEGLESLNIVINGGDVDVNASDDGVNVSGGTTDETADDAETSEDSSEDTTTDTTDTTDGASTVDADEDLVKAVTLSSTTNDDATTDTTEDEGTVKTGEMPTDGERPERGEMPADGEMPDNSEMPADGEMQKGGMGGAMGDEVIEGALVINGGTVTVTSGGDGLDSNGGMLITGGTTTVYEPENTGNGVLDANGAMEIEGGTLYAAGMTGMTQSPSDTTTQTYLEGSTTSVISAGTQLVVTDSEGNTVTTFTLEQAGNYFLISTKDLVAGEVYTIDADGTQIEITAGEAMSASGSGMGFGGNRNQTN